jgi:lysosomal acid lipase/cholesteryl ester hydrolase
MLPVILGHTPAGSSTHTIIHFAQGVNSGNFCPFDYGKKKNMQIYGQDEPPPYNLKKVKAPVALFWAENDWLSAKQVEDFKLKF